MINPAEGGDFHLAKTGDFGVAVDTRRVADRAIVWYQHTLSPRKGWTCAHLVAHGGQSCSAAVRSILAERGVLRGAPAVIRRFAACSQAAMAMPVGVQGVCCCGPIPIPFRF